MRAWWWRSVAACASLAAVAGTVAVVAAALDADRADRAADLLSAQVTSQTQPAADRARAARPGPGQAGPPERPGTAPPGAPSRAAEARVGDPATGASAAVPPGWRRVPGQRLIPVPAGRFTLVLAPNDRAAVLVGTLDPARVGTPADPARLGAEARRLTDAFVDGTVRDAPSTGLIDAADTVDGRRGWTSLRRVDGGPRDLAGTLVRVTAIEGTPRGVVALAVVRPGPGQVADARAADTVVKTLDLGTGGPGSRPAQAPRPAPAVPVVPPRPAPVRPSPTAPTGR